MLEIKAGFDRLRAVEGQKDPILLEIVAKNIGTKTQTVTSVIKIPFSLGFDNLGLEREKRIRLGEIKAGEAKKMGVPFFLKTSAREGSIPIDVKVIEHLNGRYDKAGESFSAQTKLRVIKP